MNKVLEFFQRVAGPELFRNRYGVICFPSLPGFFAPGPEDRWVGPQVRTWEGKFAYQNNNPTPPEVAEWERRAKRLWDHGRSHLPGTLGEKNLPTGEYRCLGFGYAVTFKAQFVGSIPNAAVHEQVFDHAEALAGQLIDGLRQGSRMWGVEETFLEGTLKVTLLETNML